MANDCIPFKSPGESVTAKAEGAITGKRCVQISGPRTSGPGLAATAEGSVYVVGLPSATGAAGAGQQVFGVAAWDVANNGLVTVHRGGILPITAGGSITAGDEVQVGSDGKVVTQSNGVPIGIACNDATNGNDCEVALYEGFGASGADGIVPQADIVDLTNANGTGDDTVADVGGSFNQTTLNNNFRDVSDKINEILAAMRAAGILA